MNIQTAIHYAKKYHTNLYDNQSYVYHLMQVTSLLRSWKNNNHLLSKLKIPVSINDQTIIVGWLHDILEDTECTYEELVLEFGKDVADHVKKLSKNYYDNKAEYLISVKNDIVKIADITCNLIQSLKQQNKSRVKKYASQLCLISNDDIYFNVVSSYLDSITKLTLWAHSKHVEKQNE